MHGSVTAYQVDLSSAIWARAWAESRLGQHAEAQASIDRALGILDRVTKAEPDNLDYLVEQARTLNLKGVIYDNQRQSELARKNFQDAVLLWERILARSSGLDERKLELCAAIENVGETYVDQGNVPEGLKHYREGLRLREEVRLAHPDSRGYAVDVVTAWTRFGNLQGQSGDLRDAGQSYHSARAVVEVLLQTHPQDLELQILLASVLEREGSNLAGMGENEDGLKSLLQAADLARRAVRSGSPVGKASETLSEILWQQARLYRAHGQAGEARLLDRRAICSLAGDAHRRSRGAGLRSGRPGKSDRLRQDPRLVRGRDRSSPRSPAGRRLSASRSRTWFSRTEQDQGQPRPRTAPRSSPYQVTDPAAWSATDLRRPESLQVRCELTRSTDSVLMYITCSIFRKKTRSV